LYKLFYPAIISSAMQYTCTVNILLYSSCIQITISSYLIHVDRIRQHYSADVMEDIIGLKDA